MSTLEDLVVDSILEVFQALPSKSKPRSLQNGGHEWVPLSGIAIIRDDNKITCVALGTGMKCLPANKTTAIASGTVLHDWHAEILAIRAFNHYLLQECHDLAYLPGYKSSLLRRKYDDELRQHSGQQPFTIINGVRIVMYCSEAPCGDASMELVMEAQEDATPWPVAMSNDGTSSGFLGRGSFSQLGIVRRKPARADSPQTLSKSCSDKLALKQCTSLLSSTTSLLISPENTYIHTLVIPHSQYRSVACERAFSPIGRMKSVASKVWPGGYLFHPLQVKTTTLEFEYSRHSTRSANQTAESKGSNISAVWTPRLQETLINGVLQGRKQTDPKGASAISRHGMREMLLETMIMLDSLLIDTVRISDTYAIMKQTKLLEARRRVKEDVKKDALKGWHGVE